MPATARLYLDDDHALEAAATIVAVTEQAVACDRTCFYPGGGGQPPDRGAVELPGGAVLEIVAARADADGVIWHVSPSAPRASLGGPVRLRVDRERRWALTRYHTALHVLNTLTLREHGGWLTGAQIEVDYARVDFELASLTPALCAELERRVNTVLAGDHPLRSSWISEAEFRARGDLLRTRQAPVPVADGRVRIVTIEGFDAQACGGTHARTTAEVGRLSIVRTENKGRINKRLYVRLATP